MMSADKLTAAMAAYEESTRVPVSVSQEELIASLAQAVAASIWRQWHVELTDAQDDDLRASLHSWFFETYLAFDHEAAPRA